MVYHTNMSQGDNVSAKNGEETQEKTSLIVNYLPKSFMQEDIRKLFSSVGEIESCMLMRDKEEGCSLGYGFVNFKYSQDAEAAINKLNGLKLQEKVLKVSFARPCSDAIKGTNVYIAGLPCKITDAELLSTFKKFGCIIDHRILRPNLDLVDPNAARSAALIRFDKRDEALLAINQCNGKTPPGMPSPLVVKFANSPKLKAQKRSFMEFTPIDHPPGKMMVPLSKPFPPYPSLGAPMGFLNNSWNDYNHQEVKPLNANYSNGQEEAWPLFVFNLGSNVEEGDLWQLFGPFGAIKGIRVIKDKGFAFVNMINWLDAKMAIQSLNRTNFKDRIIQVSFKISKNKY